MPDPPAIPAGLVKGARVRYERTIGVTSHAMERHLGQRGTVLSDPEVGITVKVRFGEPPDDAIFWLKHAEIEVIDG